MEAMAVIWQGGGTRRLGMLFCFSFPLFSSKLNNLIPHGNQGSHPRRGKGFKTFFLKKGYCYCPAATIGMSALCSRCWRRMECRMKDTFRKQVCLECWVTILSFWSRTTLASLVNNEKLGWLEPNGITGSCYLHAHC